MKYFWITRIVQATCRLAEVVGEAAAQQQDAALCVVHSAPVGLSSVRGEFAVGDDWFADAADVDAAATVCDILRECRLADVRAAVPGAGDSAARVADVAAE